MRRGSLDTNMDPMYASDREPQRDIGVIYSGEYNTETPNHGLRRGRISIVTPIRLHCLRYNSCQCCSIDVFARSTKLSVHTCVVA